MKILITGTAGFIGFHLAKRLLAEGNDVVGVDNINDYYDVQLKLDRLKKLNISNEQFKGEDGKFTFYNLDICDPKLKITLVKHSFDCVVNLAAQAGVRYQFENAAAYAQSNLVGFINLLEAVRDQPISHFIYASSSSVYGLNSKEIFQEIDAVDHPSSLYAATKRANELIAHSYSNLFNIPTTGLRFFTVYGPWGRPDMFMYKLADSILNDQEIQVYVKNGKSLWRDYTYIDDVVESIIRLIPIVPNRFEAANGPNYSTAPFAIYNIGKGEPDENSSVIIETEKALGKMAKVKYIEAPKTEVFKTYASNMLLHQVTGYKPTVTLKEGIGKFVKWYMDYV